MKKKYDLLLSKILNYWDKYEGNGINNPDAHKVCSLSVYYVPGFVG